MAAPVVRLKEAEASPTGVGQGSLLHWLQLPDLLARLRNRGLENPLLPLPAVLAVAVGFFLPLAVLVVYSFWPTEDGRIVCHVRNHNKANERETLQCESADGGKTWSKPKSIGVWGLPSHLLRVKDNRLLMTYGHRRAPLGKGVPLRAEAAPIEARPRSCPALRSGFVPRLSPRPRHLRASPPGPGRDRRRRASSRGRGRGTPGCRTAAHRARPACRTRGRSLQLWTLWTCPAHVGVPGATCK